MSESKNRIEAIKELYSMPLTKQDVAFIYLGSSGILIRTQSTGLAFDISDILKAREMNEVAKTDFLFFTHIHYDHFNQGKAIMFHKKTGAQIIATTDVINELREKIPDGNLTLANPGVTSTKIPLEGLNALAIRGVHAGDFSQYRIKKKGIAIFHAGDSGYLELGNQSAQIAFIPTGTPSPWCSPEVALATALYVKPKVAVATHGTARQMKKFKELMKRDMPNTEVVIPSEFKPIKVMV